MNEEIVHIKDIQNRIFTIRGLQVMIDRDLAELYHVSTKRLNEQVKRNIKRFPVYFKFQLTDTEKKELVANCDRLRKLKHSAVNPNVFTEQGVAMLSAVLHSDVAIEISIKIMQAFAEMRKYILNESYIFHRLEKIEEHQVIFQSETDKKFNQVFKALEDKSIKPKQGVFFNGQTYDAYTFVSGLIRSARKSLILIDNYIDDTVLTMFTKRKDGVSFTILTQRISKQFQLDLEKHNQQYSDVKAMVFKEVHDRFLIIDGKEIYHFGASLKDLGRKWFAFSRLDVSSVKILDKLEIMEIMQ